MSLSPLVTNLLGNRVGKEEVNLLEGSVYDQFIGCSPQNQTLSNNIRAWTKVFVTELEEPFPAGHTFTNHREGQRQALLEGK